MRFTSRPGVVGLLEGSVEVMGGRCARGLAFWASASCKILRRGLSELEIVGALTGCRVVGSCEMLMRGFAHHEVALFHEVYRALGRGLQRSRVGFGEDGRILRCLGALMGSHVGASCKMLRRGLAHLEVAPCQEVHGVLG